MHASRTGLRPRLRWLAIGSVLLLAACASGPPPTPVAVAGSKADATVTLAAVMNPNLHDRANWSGASEEAAQRCRVWGFDGAEPLGAGFEQCVQYGSGILAGTCVATREQVTFQCTGETR
jgi:hypothetical protein